MNSNEILVSLVIADAEFVLDPVMVPYPCYC
jgi:hypothetical protein